MTDSKSLGQHSIKRLLFEFSIPSIIGLSANALFNILDKIIIGRGIGEKALSAFSISIPLILIIMAFGGLISTGASSMVSTRLGRGKKAKSEVIMCNAIIIIIAISFIIATISLIYIDPLINIIAPGSAVKEYAKQFLRIVLVGSIFQNTAMTINNIIRAEGNPKVAMLTMIISAIVNISVGFLLIFVFHMGIEGSAIAMFLSQMTCFIWVCFYFFSGKSFLRIKLSDFKLQLRVIKNIFNIGFPSFFSRIMGSLITIILNRQLTIYSGDKGVAAASIISAISIVFLMPLMGINQGMQPILGYNYGSKKYLRVKKTIILGILISTVIATIGFIISMKYAMNFISMFNRSKSNLDEFTLTGLKISIFCMPLMGVQFVTTNYFQAIGKYKHSLLLAILKYSLFLLPLLILPHYFGVNGIWISNPISDIGCFSISLVFLWFEFKNY